MVLISRYVVCNMKNSDEAHIGDTMCLADKPVDALPGFKPMKAMVRWPTFDRLLLSFSPC
jgi:translation elongation factor EF-4